MVVLRLLIAALAGPVALLIGVAHTQVNMTGTPGLLCGGIDTAAKRDVMHGSYVTWKRKKEWCTAPPRTCRRQWCWNTSAFYLCNEHDVHIALPCRNISEHAGRIGKECCTRSARKSKGISGEWLSGEGWSIIVGYGNCHHDQDAGRPGPAPTPYNGACET